MKALAIGVGGAPRLAYLAGAINGAHAFHHWAETLGYESRLLTDEQAPVTIPRLQQELTTLLAGGPFDRLLVYFAGHGLIRELEEGLWLLSDWDPGLRAVDVEGLKRRLFQYGIKQIGIFADACRSLPNDVQAADLTPDRVLGRGPLAPVNADVDKFIATQDGTPTFAITGDNPEDDRCLFSWVLLEGLWGAKPEAYSTLPTLTDKVTSRSLGQYLKTEIPRRATAHGLNVTPMVSPTFAEGEDIYFAQIDAAKAPKLPDWPPRLPDLIVKTAPSSLRRDTLLSLEDSRSDEPSFADDNIERCVVRQTQAPIGRLLREQKRPDHFETQSGFAIDGAEVTALWTGPGIFAEVHGAPNWWRVGQAEGYQLQNPAPVLVEFANGKFGAVTSLPGFIGSLQARPDGDAAMIYRSVLSPNQPTISAENAFNRLEKGALRADDIADLAVSLRMEKHADPVLGVISAYLYDSIGDLESIRSVAYYYVAHGQPIPYDIALLGQLPGVFQGQFFSTFVPAVKKREPRTDQEGRFSWTYEATPATNGIVAGCWPWMRQGWPFLDDPIDAGSTLILPVLLELMSHLTTSRFATLDAEGGGRLASALGLTRRSR